MNLNTVLARLSPWYQSGLSVYLTSPPGRGKTTVIEEAPAIIAKDLNKTMGLVVINGGNLTVMDVMGFGLPKHFDDHSEMVFSEPPFFRTSEGKRLKEYDGGIIYVDEADKMSTEVKKVVGEGALSGRFGFHNLPKGWVVWMSGNRAKDRSGSTKELDHLINRRMQVEVTDDLNSLIIWMDGHGVSPLAMAFTQQNPHIVFEEMPKEQGPWCTPRSLVRADKYMQLLAKANGGQYPEDPSTIEEIAGVMGTGAAMQYFAFIKLENEMPKYEEIVKAPDKVKVPTKPDAQMLVVYNLAHRVTIDEATPIVDYVRRFPKEFGATFAHSAARRDFKLVLTPAFQKWVKENSSLLTAIGS